MKSQRAFTLIELLVVIAIIGFIASIVLVNLQGVRSRGRIAAGKQFSSSLQHTLGAYAVGIWRFEDGSGTTALDSSGYINNGTLNGGPTWRTEAECGLELGGCLEFDGVDDYVDLGTDSSLNITDAITLSVWVKADTPDSTRNFAIGKDWGGNGILILESDNKWWGVLKLDDSILWINSNVVADTDWHHISMTYDKDAGTNNWKIYVDGQFKNQLTRTGTIGRENYFWDIGWNGDNGQRWDGLIDDVYIFSVALTTAQVQKLYVEGLKKHQLAQQ